MRRGMQQSALAGLLLILGVCAACAAEPVRPAKPAHDKQSFAEIERGRYLATAGDCAACHTDPGGKPYAGGRPVETPFGMLLAPNLTPDRATGIGAWSDEDFVNALLNGRGAGGTRLYPAMPYTYYTKISRDDALAIRAYLNTLEPVHNEVKSNQLPFPFNIRLTMAGWDLLFFHAGRFQPVAGKSDEWNRGAYLVEGPGHCGLCHTPKNFLGADETDNVLQGSVLQGWFAPDLTGDPRRGLGSWSADDIVAYLKTGHNRISFATGPMSEVISDSTSRMTDDDLKAIAAYLKDQAAPKESPPAAVSAQNNSMRSGETIYVDNCSACHGPGGKGITHLFPALDDNPIVQSKDATSLIRVTLEGAQNVATQAAPTGPAMPAFYWKLSNAQIADALTYIRNSWGNRASAVSSGQVDDVRSEPTQR